jgi:hypothetical protein
MMTRLFQHPWGWTSVAPILCAIHCLAAPILVAFAPAFAPGEAAEWALLGITVVLVAAAGVAAFRGHRTVTPFVVIGVGLLGWGGSLLHVFHPVPESATTVAAALTVALGLLWNSRLHCGTSTAPCSACELEAQEHAHGHVAAHLAGDDGARAATETATA